MSQDFDRPVCGLCRKIFNDQLDDEDEWREGSFEDPEREREYDHLCPGCYAVVVEGAPETRAWLATE